jgi:hypothetical protein
MRGPRVLLQSPGLLIQSFARNNAPGNRRAPRENVDDARAWLREEMTSWRRDLPEAGIVADE